MHVSDHDMLLYLEDRLPTARRQSIERHMGNCNGCARQFAALARLPNILEETIPIEVNEATMARAKALVRAERPALRWLRIPLARYRVAFAGLAAAAAISTVVLLFPVSETQQFRSVDRTAPGFTMSPPDGAHITELQPQFAWSSIRSSPDLPSTAGSVYKFSLLDQQGVTVWSLDVRDTSVMLPASVVLVPGKTYLWRVESFLVDRSLERSSLHAFTYNPSK